MWVRVCSLAFGGGNELPGTFGDRRWIWVGHAYFARLHFTGEMRINLLPLSADKSGQSRPWSALQPPPRASSRLMRSRGSADTTGHLHPKSPIPLEASVQPCTSGVSWWVRAAGAAAAAV